MIFCIGCSERGMMHVRIDYAGCASQRIVNAAAPRRPLGFRSDIAASFWPRGCQFTVINTGLAVRFQRNPGAGPRFDRTKRVVLSASASARECLHAQAFAHAGADTLPPERS